MKATRTVLVATALAAALGSRQSSAQCVGVTTCTTTHTVEVSVNALVQLGMGSAMTTLTSPTPSDLANGAVVPDPGPTLTISANRSWTLNIRSQNPTSWDYAGGGGGVKPIGDLAWSSASGGTFVAITNTDAVFTSGASGTLQLPAQLFFRTTWSAGFGAPNNAPGLYTLPIVLTLSTP